MGGAETVKRLRKFVPSDKWLRIPPVRTTAPASCLIAIGIDV